MPVHNSDIAKMFNKAADLLEIKEANQFRVRAYRNAARTIENLSKRASDLVKNNGDISDLPGIGDDLAGKIKTIVETGKFPLLKDLQKSLPAELSELMEIPRLGPKKIKVLNRELGIKTLKQLEKAAKEKKIRELPGFGEKTEQAILQGIQIPEAKKDRIKISRAEEIINSLIDYLKEEEGITKIEVAGSNRRKKETVKDADILASCKNGSKLMERFLNYEDVEKVIAGGESKSTVRLRSGFHVDLRLIPGKSFGSALLYFTGSKAHNISIRKIAVNKNLKINEYGIYRGKKRLAGKTEEEMYDKIGLKYIEPELREDRGEVEAAREDKLPKLVTLKDIRGDLHFHTKETDGHHSLEEMARAAIDMGYRYIGCTEHTKHVSVAGGMDSARVRKYLKTIDKVNKKLEKITILKGMEVDILEDGSLDLPDDVLKELDYTVCAVHYKLKLSEKKQTERVLKAMDNPYCNIIAHPTGRMINERPPYPIDIGKIIEGAKERGCIMEVNAHTARLDLNDIHCKAAKEAGVKISIGTDAHSVDGLNDMRFGVYQARRGWLEPSDVINTFSISKMKKHLKRK